MFDVVVCGSLHLDIVVNAPVLPRIDETAVGSRWAQVCGGKGGNQAVQSTRAGARTAMIGCIGADDFGATLSANLKAVGVDVTCVDVDDDTGSGMSVAIVQHGGDYGAVIVSGSNLKLDAERVAAQWTSLGGGKVLVLQNEVPEVVNIAAAKVARRAGAIVVFNAAPARDLNAELMQYVDVLVVNRVEASAMSKVQVTDFASAGEAVANLRAGKRSVVITLGSAGLLLAACDAAAVEIPAVPVQVTSTHGAGDCFVGVLAAQMAGGVTLVEACEAANAKAAAHVARN